MSRGAPPSAAGAGPILTDALPIRVFLLALVGLLAGYMFLGRGFAHLGARPVYLSEVVLALGFLAAAYAIVRLRVRPVLDRRAPTTWIVGLLVAFMVLGLARTVPYLGEYGVDAFRDAVLWGYGFFALFLFLLANRSWLAGTARIYGAVLPFFAVWLPIVWYLFAYYLDWLPIVPGSTVPIPFFKNQDMGVHTAGAIAFLILVPGAIGTAAEFIRRSAIATPLVWTVFMTGSLSRGALASIVTAMGLAVLATRRLANWLPLILATVLVTGFLVVTGPLAPSPGPEPTPTPTPIVSPSPGVSPTPSESPTATASPTPQPTPSPGRQFSLAQLIDNITSVLGTSFDPDLEGTKQFRLAWWRKIVEYTVFGPYFWDGKGFGINLADDDGFQPTEDGSLRAPHNSHLSTLARMGVPGFVLWSLLQLGFGVFLLRAILAHRRSGDDLLAVMGAWILIYWTAMMVNTSFDPYLEGPQGGIWFWTLFGLGLTVIRLARPPRLA